MPSIYDLVTAKNVATYWTELNQNQQPYLGATLFPVQKQLGTNLEWIKGANNQPVGIRLSSYDAKAIRRDMQGITKYETEMPFFKESVYVDEKLRQQLNNFIDANKPQIVDTLMTKVFDRVTGLIASTDVTLERMRMEALTTGTITLSSNGQSYTYDYEVPADQKKSATKSWTDPSADIIGDINKIITDMKAKGVKITRALCNTSVIRGMLQNTAMKNAIYVFAGGTVNLTEETVRSYITAQTGLRFAIYDNVWVDENGTAHKYVPDNTVVFMPEGNLGYTNMGTTPEESDLINNLNAEVSIVNEGVAVTTSQMVDPVNVDTKVSMVALPSFEEANKVVIFDTEVVSG
jgi:hypothetical protein